MIFSWQDAYAALPKKNTSVKPIKTQQNVLRWKGAPGDLIVSFPSADQPFLCSVLSSYFGLEWVNENINK